MTVPTPFSSLKPGGVLDIARASDLRRQLLDCLSAADAVVEIDLADVTAVDLSFFQILCAAHRSAERQGIALRLVNCTRCETLGKVLRDAGISRHVGCLQASGADCLWSDEG